MVSRMFRSSDGIQVEITDEVVNRSKTIRNLLSDLGIETGDDDNTIPLDAPANILQLVIEWATHHKNDPVFYDEDRRPHSIELTEWDQEFLNNLDNGILFDLIRASSYLDLVGLRLATCKKVAEQIRGKPLADIRQFFGAN